MPHLKIQDVKDQLELTDKALNEKFDGLVEEIKEIMSSANVSVDTSKIESQLNVLRDEVSEIRSGLVGHVEVYNKHIIEQHSKSRK